MRLCPRILFPFFFCLLVFSSAQGAPLNYASSGNWAFQEDPAKSGHAVDVFFVCPTAYMGSAEQHNMPIDDPQARQFFLGATLMEKGIYDQECNFYAPYYRQASLSIYKLPRQQSTPYFSLAYEDVKAAFSYYLREHNQGRPVILAGFSQGGDMVLRLIKDVYRDPALQQKLVAAYAIGWPVTPTESLQYPQLKMAQHAEDTGVVISFNTEAPEVTSSLLVPEKTLSINPLNWKTTSEPADKSLNLGAVFVNYHGEITKEVPQLTGAYLDPARGALKVTDINSADYPPMLDLFQPGVYHVYDYLFFYRNLQQNVADRIKAYEAKQSLKQAS
nr:DUF3089 domain-containing protein [uncultured Anaeromusa sp.]